MKYRFRKIMALLLTAGLLCTLPTAQVFAEEMDSVQTEEGSDVQAGTDAETALEDITNENNTEDYPVSGSLFDDVSDSSWFLPYVTYTLNKGIMTGKGNNQFAPGEALARAQFAVVLWRISGSPAASYAGTYPDVPENTFYTSAVEWASGADVGVIGGYENGKFGPNDNITREQLVTMVYRFAKNKELDMSHKSNLKEFPDVGDVTEFAEDAMKWAVGSGIITGDKGRLNPQGNTNRAECAAILQRFCETYMPGELKNLDFSASCGWCGAAVTNETLGEFWMKVEDPKASRSFSKVQVQMWCYDDGSDAGVYDLSKQSDGSWGGSGLVRYHGNHSGTYKMQAYVLLDVGVRIPVGSVQAVNMTKSEGYYQVMDYVQNIYEQVGYDLNACFWWCVNNISYRTLPIPLEPAEGYSRPEWYAMQAFMYGSGNCYVYASTFYFCALGLGYNAEFIEGYVPLARGGYGPHGWTMIYLNGAAYICDPESQRDIGRYNFYMQPVGNTVFNYQW